MSISTVLALVQLILASVLGVICVKLAYALEDARYVGAGLIKYMTDHGLELPPPEEMRRIIDSYWEDDA